MTAPEAFFEPGFAEGGGQLHMRNGDIWDLPVPQWSAEAGPGDLPLLARCVGNTLDVGCGPGRMTAALTDRGVQALGVDVSPSAVAMARARGAHALNRDIFSLSGGWRRWQHILLVDGNVGIGGDPVRLLWLCRELLVPGGTVLVDLAPPGRGLRVTTARLVGATGPGAWFAWALLGIDALEVVAAAAGLRVADAWLADGERWQAELVHAERWPSLRSGEG